MFAYKSIPKLTHYRPTFPSTCLSPEQPGYGQVVASTSGRRRRGRNNPPPTTLSTSRDSQTNWTVVTPRAPASSGSTSHHAPKAIQPYASSSSRYSADPYYAADIPRSYLQHRPSEQPHSSVASSPPLSTTSIPHDWTNNIRYSPYPQATTLSRRPSSSSRGSLKVDIPLGSVQHAPAANTERILLPPIHAPAQSMSLTQFPYALPPISAMENLRGAGDQDSAAVLRRLSLNDDSPSDSERLREEELRSRRRSLSVPPHK